MKKTLNVAVGGRSFIIENDAYNTLSSYLDSYKADLGDSSSSAEVMEELEMRIADLMKEKMGKLEVVSDIMVEEVLDQIEPKEQRAKRKDRQSAACHNEEREYRPGDSNHIRKFYRDAENKKLAGVCSGLALYLNVDTTLIRIIFLVALFCGSAGLWIYFVLWIVAPEAKTAAEKCELRGMPATAENIRKFTEGKQ